MTSFAALIASPSPTLGLATSGLSEDQAEDSAVLFSAMMASLQADGAHLSNSGQADEQETEFDAVPAVHRLLPLPVLPQAFVEPAGFNPTRDLMPVERPDDETGLDAADLKPDAETTVPPANAGSDAPVIPQIAFDGQGPLAKKAEPSADAAASTPTAQGQPQTQTQTQTQTLATAPGHNGHEADQPTRPWAEGEPNLATPAQSTAYSAPSLPQPPASAQAQVQALAPRTAQPPAPPQASVSPPPAETLHAETSKPEGRGQAILQQALQTSGASLGDHVIATAVEQSSVPSTPAPQVAAQASVTQVMTMVQAEQAPEQVALLPLFEGADGDHLEPQTPKGLTQAQTQTQPQPQPQAQNILPSTTALAAQAPIARERSARPADEQGLALAARDETPSHANPDASPDASQRAATPATGSTVSYSLTASFQAQLQGQIQGQIQGQLQGQSRPQASGLDGSDFSLTTPRTDAGQGLMPQTEASPSLDPILTTAPASGLSKATLETTAQISAQILRRLEGRTTRFDMTLTPEVLGRVDVSLKIEADGQVTARLAFDNPAAAIELRGRVDELRRQLAEAGLDLPKENLEFADRNPQSGSGNNAFDRQQDRRAFAGAGRLNDEADLATTLPPAPWASSSQTPDRVDVKV